MTKGGSPPPYSIVVTQRRGVYELRIPELLLVITATDLQDGHDRLRKRQQEVIDFARSVEALDELPSPAKPPTLKSIFS